MKNGSLVNKKVAKVLQRLKVDHPGRPYHFVLAVSGGPDSQCLLKVFPHVLQTVWPESTCEAIGVNHGLRAEADKELDLAQALAATQDVKFTRVQIHVEHGSNLQARARDARYEALIKSAVSHERMLIVTAHHFDDRAETVLIRLLRGKNLGSLAVLPALSGKIFRPMLNVTREEIESYLGYWGIQFATDPSNSNTKYLRVKIRKEILPLLESVSPQIKKRLNDIADEILNEVV